MIKVNIVCVGKIKEPYLRQAMEEYSKRLSRFCRLNVVELEEGKSLSAEAPAILNVSAGYKMALCIEGSKLSSEDFAEKIKRLCDEGKEISFIIGSSCGLDESVKRSSDFKLSFSDMTFPHMLARVMLAEQIYRAFMINSGAKYHK